MDRTEELRTGVAEMRSVAQRLSEWAEYLDATFLRPKADEAEVPAAASGEPRAAEEKKAPLKLPEVRALLAEKCAAGFSAQVKALIESYGFSSLKDVPAEKYEELLEAVRGWGEPLSTAGGGSLERVEVTRNERSVRGTVATIEGAGSGPEVQDAG